MGKCTVPDEYINRLSFELSIPVETLKDIYSHTREELANMMYLEWSRENQRLSMTSIMAEMFLVAHGVESDDFKSNIREIVQMHAENEWGPETKVSFQQDAVTVSRFDKSVRFVLNKMGVVSLED